jgi:hypothetical protein
MDTEQRSRNQRRRPDLTAENAETAKKGREGKIIYGKIMKGITNLRFEISKPKICAGCENFEG